MTVMAGAGKCGIKHEGFVKMVKLEKGRGVG